MANSLNKLFEESIRNNWDRPALSDYNGVTLHYRDLARKIAKLHIIYEESGVKKGDTISICSRNQANWGVVFIATLSYGAVPVPILHEFKNTNIHNLVNHSESKILFVGDMIWEELTMDQMPNLDAAILLNDFSLLHANNAKVESVMLKLNELFGKKYPASFTPKDVIYHRDSPEELAIINYTSGTSGFSKGVMIPYRSVISNVLFAKEVQPHMDNQSSCVAMLPTAHTYGMSFEFLFELTVGSHVHFLTRLPTPNIILEAFKKIKPGIIVAVPLIIEKIYKKKLEPLVERRDIRLLLKLPVVEQQIKRKINKELEDAFGGNYQEVIVGGAALNKEAERFFKKIGFRYTVGYGMTECGPIISYAPWNENKLFSCGKAAPRMRIRIDSNDPENIPGEIQVLGDNLFLGYYKNQEATNEVFTEDGWFKTGDLGVMDNEGFLFIKGRSKNMLLGPSGQNIYPEELECQIDNMPYVMESLVIQENGLLKALIHPDIEAATTDGLSEKAIYDKMLSSIKELNQGFPNYAQISNIEIMPEEFEKTPKRSIKRYLYQRG